MSDISHIQVDNTVYDLKDNVARETKAPLASPALTGNPTAPTQSEGDNSTKLATTAYVDRGLSNKENTIIQTSTGPIAHFEDGLDVNMLDVKCAIEPVQDLHGYDYPWPAGGGKNLLDLGANLSDWFVTMDNGVSIRPLRPSSEIATGTVNGLTGSITITQYNTSGYPWMAKWLDLKKNTDYYISSTSTVKICGGNTKDNNTTYTQITYSNNVFNTGNYDYWYITIYPNNYSVSSLFICLNSETDKTFVPYSNICPISGFDGMKITRTGKNLFDWTASSSPDCTISNGTYTNNVTDTRSFLEIYYREYMDSTQLSNKLVLNVYNIGRYSFTIDNLNEKTNRISLLHNGKTHNIIFWHCPFYISSAITISFTVSSLDPTTAGGLIITDFQIEPGSTASSYEPYNSDIATYDITFPTEAGTVYGGTYDPITGELVVTHCLEELDGNSISYIETSSYGIKAATFSNSLKYGSITDTANCLSNIYNKFVANGANNNACRLAPGYSSRSVIIYDNRFADLETAQRILNETPCQIWYPLTEPLIFHLTPQDIKTLEGVNNIFADTGDTIAKYWKNSDIANYIDNHKAVLEQMTGYKRYGVKGVGQAASALTRTYDAVGMEANVGSKTLKVNNDFDNVPPFHRRKCVGYWEKNLAHEKRAVFHVLKYEGDDGYTEDGTMGDYVAVECPRCYYKLDGDELIISAHRYDGYRAFDIFCHEHNQNDTMEYYYMPAYPLATKDGHAVSLPGLRNEQGDWATLYNKTKTYNNSDIAQLAQLMPAAVNFYEWALMTVEFATQNIQDIMYGVAECYNGDSKSGQFTSLENTITFECNNNLTGIIAGDYIGIGNYSGGTDYRTYTSHKVLSATSYNSKRILTLEETGWSNIEYNSTSTYYISGRHVPTGLTEDILTPSGVENHTATASHNAMRYRYHENCYGNQYHTSADLFDVAMIIPNATTTSVNVKYGASLDWYYLPDPTSITTATNPTNNTTSLSSDDRFVKLGVFTPSENYASGYIVSKKYDLDYPDIWIPNVTENGSASTYFADQAYLVSSYVCRSVRFGGDWSSGANAGPSHAYAHAAPSHSYAISGGDLYFPQ